MSAYAARATAIQSITTDLRHRMEIASVCGTIADKMVVIDLGVEILNKILACFLVSEEMLVDLDQTLNRYYRGLTPQPSSVIRVFYTLMSFVCALEKKAIEWVERYCK